MHVLCFRNVYTLLIFSMNTNKTTYGEVFWLRTAISSISLVFGFGVRHLFDVKHHANLKSEPIYIVYESIDVEFNPHLSDEGKSDIVLLHKGECISREALYNVSEDIIQYGADIIDPRSRYDMYRYGFDMECDASFHRN